MLSNLFQIYFEAFGLLSCIYAEEGVEKILALSLVLMLLKDKCISRKSNAFKIALKGIDFYCCFEIKHIKDNVILLIYSRKGNKNHNGLVCLTRCRVVHNVYYKLLRFVRSPRKRHLTGLDQMIDNLGAHLIRIIFTLVSSGLNFGPTHITSSKITSP